MLHPDITECTRMSIPHYQSLQNNLLQNPENGGYIFSQFHRLKIHGAPVKTHTVADAERVMINANLESLAITGLGNEFHFQKHFCLTFPTPLPSLELNFESGTAVRLEEISRPFLMGETGGILKRSLSLFVRNTETIKLANITLQVYDGSEKKMGGSGWFFQSLQTISLHNVQVKDFRKASQRKKLVNLFNCPNKDILHPKNKNLAAIFNFGEERQSDSSETSTDQQLQKRRRSQRLKM